MMTGGDFHDDCRDFHEDSPRFVLVTDHSVIVNGRDFLDDVKLLYLHSGTQGKYFSIQL